MHPASGCRFIDLKTWPEPFKASKEGRKPYEVRSNLDRRFEVGDVLVLREWVPFFPHGHAFIEIYGSNGQHCAKCGRPPKAHRPEDPNAAGKYTGEVLYRKISYITRGGTFGLPTDVDVLGLEREQ